MAATSTLVFVNWHVDGRIVLMIGARSEVWRTFSWSVSNLGAEKRRALYLKQEITVISQSKEFPNAEEQMLSPEPYQTVRSSARADRMTSVMSQATAGA